MPSSTSTSATHGESTIVVVDDDADIREGVREMVPQEGYHTMGAANGKEALQLLRSSPTCPQLILLDLMMPVMDGWEFLLGIDEDDELRSIPIALMSSHPSVRRTFES